MAFDYLKRIKEIPAAPGVYLMKDTHQAVIYVGKSVSLKDRVRSYFRRAGDPRYFVELLADLLAEIDIIVTRNNKEAVLLEAELIKKYKPRFNAILKDDKNFLSIRIDLNSKWPAVELVRKIKKDGAKYFGPFHQADIPKKILEVIEKYFFLRRCRDQEFKNRKRPCLNYQIKRCLAPCCHQISEKDYRENLKKAIFLLHGKISELTETIRQEMNQAAQNLNFEAATRLRDQLLSIETLKEKQHVISEDLLDRDGVGFFREGESVAIQVICVRGGRVMDHVSHLFLNQRFPAAEILSSFLVQYYSALDDIPPEILIPFEIEGLQTLMDLLKERYPAQAVVIHVPKKGGKLALVQMAKKNAEVQLKSEMSKEKGLSDLLQQIQTLLGLKEIPERIEGFDISNIAGKFAVGSKVSFFQGEADKSHYRRYRIRLPQEPDDYGMMYEVLSRRISRGIKESDLPNLILLDGGKGQLNVGKRVFQELKVTSVELLALAKEKNRNSDSSPAEADYLYQLKSRDPIILKRNHPVLLFLQRVRDEAHRFAITYHRQIKDKGDIGSVLNEVPGIGAAKIKSLMAYFKGIADLRERILTDYQRVKGISKKEATAIYLKIQGEGPKGEGPTGEGPKGEGPTGEGPKGEGSKGEGPKGEGPK